MKKLGIIGASDLALQIANIAFTCGYSEVFFFADTPSNINDGRVIIAGTVNDVFTAFNKGSIDEVAIGVGYNNFQFREKVFDELVYQKVSIATIIHPTCIVDPTASIDPGCILYPGVIVDMNVHIHANVLLNLSCVISHDSKVLSHSFISPSVSVAGFCQVGSRVFLGINSTLADGVTLCNDVKVGASSLIIKDIKEPGTYVGSPAIPLISK